MATIYKSFASSDAVQTRTLLHESVPITGAIASGTYNIGKTTTEENIKDFAHGMFQSVYDYPFLSSSANHIFDLTFGYSNQSQLSGASNSQNAKKINLYNEFAQVLAGYDETGSIRRFDRDGDLTTGTKLNECIFLNFARLLTKDEIKKGTFTMYFHTGTALDTYGPAPATLFTASDFGAATDYRVNSPAGEYGILYTSSATPDATGESGIGLIYYQAGVVVLTASVFAKSQNPPAKGVVTTAGGTSTAPNFSTQGATLKGKNTIDATLTGATISANADALRHRLYSVEFDNTTELNSTVYFCRINHNDYNYSANPTYLTGSKIRVKGEKRMNLPVAYPTTVGLYSADRELLAVAKLSEPLKKDPNTELTLRVRLDY